jgi:YbgC/YbaW family acyl-CoA thioester hydrolase
LNRTTSVPAEYRHKRRVQFYETDMAGLVHFSWFFRYMEEAEHALWRQAGLSIARTGEEIGWPRVAAAFDYHSPLRFEDEFEVTIRIQAVHSRTIEYVCHITKDETRIATGTLRVACVLRRPGQPLKSTIIPADVAARLTGG